MLLPQARLSPYQAGIGSSASFAVTKGEGLGTIAANVGGFSAETTVNLSVARAPPEEDFFTQPHTPLSPSPSNMLSLVLAYIAPFPTTGSGSIKLSVSN